MYKIFSSPLFYFMLFHFVVLLVLFFLNSKYLLIEFRKVNKKFLVMLFVVFMIGFCFRNSEYWLGWHTDGYVAQESAKMWMIHGEHYKSCALGNQADCLIKEQVLAPPGFPFLIVLAHLFFGMNSINASIISALLSSLLIVIVFFIVKIVYKNDFLGLLASFFYSIIPLNIINSQTGLSRPTGLFFSGLALYFFLLANKRKKLVNWLAFVSFLSYAIYVRQETYILVPFFGLLIVIFYFKKFKEVIHSSFSASKKNIVLSLSFVFTLLFFLLLQIPVLRWLLFDNPYNSYQGGGWFALNYKGFIMQGSALFEQFFNILFAGHIFHYNTLVSFLFVMGFFLSIFTKRKEIWTLNIFFISYFLVYSLMSDALILSGEMTTDYFRRSLMFNISYVIYAAYAFMWIFLRVKRKKLLEITGILLIIFSSVLFVFIFDLKIIQSGDNYRYVYGINGLFKDARASKEDAYPDSRYWEIIERIPNGCTVIMGPYLLATNDYFSYKNLKTVQIDMISEKNQNVFYDFFKNAECVYYIEDFRCRAFEVEDMDLPCNLLSKMIDHLEHAFTVDGLRVHKATLVIK